MPERIQRKRDKGWKMPDGAVYVGRPSRHGNPYKIGEIADGVDVVNANVATTMFRDIYLCEMWSDFELPSPAEIQAELRGKDLACWCPLDQPCHADVLLELANEGKLSDGRRS